MGLIAERSGIGPVFVVAGVLAVVGALLMRAVPQVPERADVAVSLAAVS